MISTTCPGCAAKFQVPEALVAGKLVRFRCRKCGGTIAVDGNDPAALGAEVPPEPGRTSRKKTLLFGQPAEPKDAPGAPPAPIVEAAPMSLSEVQPASVAEPKFDLERTPPPSEAKQVPVEPPAAPAHAPEPAPQETKAPEAASAKPTPAPPAQTPAPEEAKPASAPSPVPAAAAPSTEPGGDGNGKPVGKIVLPKPGGAKYADQAKTAAAKHESDKPAAEPAARVAAAKGPTKAGGKVDAPGTKRSARISMELGGVFATPSPDGSTGGSLSKDDVDVDFEVELDEKPLDLAPLPSKLAKGPPPAPQLKKVVLDLGDFGDTGGPESQGVPSVAFFSPVLIPQMQLSAPASPLLEARGDEEKPAPARMKSGQGMLWAAVIASAGILFAGGFLLWSSLSSQAPEQPTRTGAAEATPTSTVPVIEAPRVVATADPVPAADPAASAPPSAASAAASAKAPAPETTAAAKPAGDEPKKVPGPLAAADTPKKADTPAAAAPPEPKAPEPSKPTKQPQPTESSSEIPFDRSAAAAAIAAKKGAAAGCKQEGGPTGHAKVAITFAPSGRVTTANINGPPFAGTPVGGCIASKFRSATVPPFSGAPVTVHTSVAIF